MDQNETECFHSLTEIDLIVKYNMKPHLLLEM